MKKLKPKLQISGNNNRKEREEYCESCRSSYKYTRGKQEGYCNCEKNKKKEEKTCRHVEKILRKVHNADKKLFVFGKSNELVQPTDIQEEMPESTGRYKIQISGETRIN